MSQLADLTPVLCENYFEDHEVTGSSGIIKFGARMRIRERSVLQADVDDSKRCYLSRVIRRMNFPE